MSAEGTKMPEPIRAFAEYANDKGYDIAYTYDTERSRWVFLNPMTADLWRYWQEATRLAMERAAKAVRSRESTMSMFATSRECIAHNDAVNECEDAIRRALADVDAKEVGK